ncbi:MAG: O-antigen ligase family protein [Proteobacteria bacterium]|nr:O-antigen ligase family protein [Pseudomonadota bacterium]MBU1454722.1 O-antigen ligase family protein [Pseudomonadota bacterium]
MRALSFILFLTTLFFAPLAFGSVETWSIAVVEILVFLAALSYFFQGKHEKQPYLQVPGFLPLLLLILWMFLQLIPLPPPLVKVISPGIYQAYAPLLNLQETSLWIPLTVNQKATLLEALRLTSYAVFYILTVQLLSRNETLTKTVRIIAWLAMAIAFLAIIQKFTSPDEIYWFRPTPENAGTVGPWVYHNHYAGFMELVFPLVLALFFHYRPSFTYQQTLRARTVAIFTAPGSNMHFFLGFGIILILASVFIALSRGGIISISLGLLFFLLLLARKNSASGKLLPLILLGSVLLAVTWFGWEPILTKINRTVTETGGIADGRLLVWQDCIPLIRDFLFTGSGFGTFINVYPQYSTLPTSAIFDHAHNDYIELVTDGGLIGFLLAAWFVITIIHQGFQRLKNRREPYSLLLIICGLTAIFSLLIHSVTDFNMHNGANGLYFFFLCGILVSAGNTRLRYRTRSTLLTGTSPKWKLACLAAIPLLLLTISFQGGILRAKGFYRQASTIYISPQLSEKTFQNLLTTTDKAIHSDPLEAFYSYFKGNLLSYQQQGKPAFHNYLQAAKKDPLEGAYLQRLGLVLAVSDNTKASFLMAEGYARSQNKENLVFIWAEWLLRQDRKQEALTVLQQGMDQFPRLARGLPPLLIGSQLSRDEIKDILPERVTAWIQLGDFSEKLGRLEDAEYYRSHALDFLKHEETVKPWYFDQLYRFYQKQKRTEEAVATLRQGIEWLPNHAPFHISLGDYYKQQAIPYRAREEYEQALMLEPGNEKIRNKLQSLQ